MTEHGNFTVVSYGQKYLFLNDIFRKYIFYSNFKYKIPDVRQTEEKKKASFPGTFFSK